MIFLRSFFVAIVTFALLQQVDAAEYNSAFTNQEELDQAVLVEFQIITREYFQQMAKAQENTSPSFLAKGLWYPTDYYELLKNRSLKSASAKKRLEWMIEHDSFIKGLPNKFLKSEATAASPLVYWLNNASPSDAITNIGKDSAVIIDCGIAYQLAYYRVALKFLGESVFNDVFGSGNNAPLFASTIETTKLNQFLTVHQCPDIPGQAGSIYYIKNHLAYQFKNRYGDARGFNLLVLRWTKENEPLFVGLGLSPEGLTKQQILNVLVEAFNRDSYDGCFVSRATWNARDLKSLNEHLATFFHDRVITSVDDLSMMQDMRNYFAARFSPEETEKIFRFVVEQFESSPPIGVLRLDYDKLRTLLN